MKKEKKEMKVIVNSGRNELRVRSILLLFGKSLHPFFSAELEL